MCNLEKFSLFLSVSLGLKLMLDRNLLALFLQFCKYSKTKIIDTYKNSGCWLEMSYFWVSKILASVASRNSEFYSAIWKKRYLLLIFSYLFITRNGMRSSQPFPDYHCMCFLFWCPYIKTKSNILVSPFKVKLFQPYWVFSHLFLNFSGFFFPPEIQASFSEPVPVWHFFWHPVINAAHNILEEMTF